ncbi:MAG: hypothetical protein IJL85_01240 [Erysipelotrichaceae bacterium]|nr:hypothetical protein [Erysipelotrichaceae bacterium]
MCEIMSYLLDQYEIRYKDKTIGYYYIYEDGGVSYSVAWGCPWDIEEELKTLGLNKEFKTDDSIPLFDELIDDRFRVPGRKRIIYQKDPLTLERRPKETGERFSVYRRAANEGDPDYSPLPHDAPHHEGPNTPEGMREWASWYAFNRMDDGTYETELDEAWWWGGGHNDGGTIRQEIPEEWFVLPYEEFLNHVVTLSAAEHYGFTADMLKEREGLREFFGFES